MQGGLILNLKILDQIMITERSYYSFANSGLKELEHSKKYVPDYNKRKNLKAGRSCNYGEGQKRNGSGYEIFILPYS